MDYRDLNRASPKDNFPLPHIDILVDNTANFALFSFMDGFSGYNQIKMAPEDMEKTTFVTLCLGLAGYYRKFIEGFSKLALILTKLTRKNEKFVWNEKCDQSFQELKRRLTTAPVLILPDPKRTFEVYCDASGQGLGCVLMQEGRVVAYASRQLRPHE
ncbi:RNase H-like domain-containing protein, partial [Psychrobacter sp. NG27]|uniref:RNase H-like domain-containing protein n=1 Tax=Psychrobacter sp. NG27 TaxID=2781966 RepID=UPI0018DFC47A